VADERPDVIGSLLSWPFRVADELLRVPDTMKALRELTEDLAATSRAVRSTIADVASTLDPLTGAVDRVANIDRAVTELHAVFFTFLEKVPGSKRALRGTPFDLETRAGGSGEGEEAVDPESEPEA